VGPEAVVGGEANEVGVEHGGAGDLGRGNRLRVVEHDLGGHAADLLEVRGETHRQRREALRAFGTLGGAGLP
jgi:hypothetical protein